MSKWPKIFLVISVTAFAFGLTSVGNGIAYGALKPIGAIFFGLFFITQILNKEIAQYDEERRSNIRHRISSGVSSAKPTATGATSRGVFDTASLATGRSV